MSSSEARSSLTAESTCKASSGEFLGLEDQGLYYVLGVGLVQFRIDRKQWYCPRGQLISAVSNPGNRGSDRHRMRVETAREDRGLSHGD